MEAVGYSHFRQHLKTYMRQVNDDAEALVVTSRDVEDAIVVLSKRDYDNLLENARILSNDYLMDKIKRGDAQFQAGTFQNHELLEVDDDD